MKNYLSAIKLELILAAEVLMLIACLWTKGLSNNWLSQSQYLCTEIISQIPLASSDNATNGLELISTAMKNNSIKLIICLLADSLV